MEYTKEFKERDELLDQLSINGLSIPDDSAALDFLTRVGYFRSGAYRYVFRKFLDEPDERLRQYRSDDYIEGATLDHVIKLEAFDSKLSRVCLEGVLDFEVRLRASVAHTLARKNVAAHLRRECLDARMCDKPTGHGETKLEAWARTCEKAIDDAKQDEDFVAHHLAKYPEQDVPIWAVTEILSFGNLPFLLDLMTAEDAREVAQTFGFTHPRQFKTAVRAMVDLRNVCAHGSRLFNRVFKRRFSIERYETAGSLLDHFTGPSFTATPKGDGRLYIYAAVLAFMLRSHTSGTKWHLTFKTQVDKLDTSFCAPDGQPLLTPEISMGFPEGWRELDLWKQ